MSYVSRLAKVVNVLAIRQVKQRIGFTLHYCETVNVLTLYLITPSQMVIFVFL